MPEKLTFEHVKHMIEKEDGYKLLSNEYVNAQTKLRVKCKRGHEYLVSYNAFQIGLRCKTCYFNSKKISYEYVKKIVEDADYQLISEIFDGSRSKIRVRCKRGHEYNVLFHNFKYGGRCRQCYSDNQKLER